MKNASSIDNHWHAINFFFRFYLDIQTESGVHVFDGSDSSDATVCYLNYED